MMERMTHDLVQFLRDRLDEEQREAEAALKRTTTTRRMIQGQWVEDTVQPPEWRRSAWSPARVLAEVDAKRQVLAAYMDAVLVRDQATEWALNKSPIVVDPGSETFERWSLARDAALVLDPVIRLLAVPYADHPDYRDEWRP
jgi:hypothetical protein